jgi:hypothetical protein
MKRQVINRDLCRKCSEYGLGCVTCSNIKRSKK